MSSSEPLGPVRRVEAAVARVPTPAGDAALTFAGVALFPGLSHRLRWYARLGLRGSVVWIAFRVALAVAAIALVWRMKALQEHIRAEVRSELGYEPTPEQLHEHVRRRAEEGR